jgi:hypothetical protein
MLPLRSDPLGEYVAQPAPPKILTKHLNQAQVAQIVPSAVPFSSTQFKSQHKVKAKDWIVFTNVDTVIGPLWNVTLQNQ